MTYQLEQYQEDFISSIAKEASNGSKAILAQLETGGGKTVCFATIAHRFLEKTKKDVIIFVDSDAIFKQTRRTLFNWYQIDSDIINAEQSQIKINSLFGCNRVFIAMVETFDRRAGRLSFLSQLRDVGLVIVDECHMGNFIKIFEHFPEALRIGFTATPIASDKKKPLRNYYDKIVCGPKTSELIQFNQLNPGRGVVRDIVYCNTGNVDRERLEELSKGDDINQDLAGEELSGDRQIGNTIKAYVEHTPQMKALCFNANVKHSKLVTEEMVKYGLNARHLDGTCTDEYRKAIFLWLKETPNAILCNVGMTTKGFDEPSVEVTILNTLTRSITKFRQMCGRSARPYQYPSGKFKDHHFVLDLCDNVLGGGHGQWSDDIDWQYIFENPKLPRPGVAPSKECPECGYICSASTRKCRGLIQDFYSETGEMIECGYEFPIKEVSEDTVERQLVLVSKNIDVNKIINYPKFQGKKDWFTFYETVRACAYYTRQDVKYNEIDSVEFEKIWFMTRMKITEWQTIKGRSKEDGRKIRDTDWYNSKGREMLLQYLREYGFIVNLVDESKVEDLEDNHHLIGQET